MPWTGRAAESKNGKVQHTRARGVISTKGNGGLAGDKKEEKNESVDSTSRRKKRDKRRDKRPARKHGNRRIKGVREKP